MKNALIFLSGVLVGSGVTFVITKKRLDDLANKEIDEILQAYGPMDVKSTEKMLVEDEKSVEKEENQAKMDKNSLDYGSFSSNLVKNYASNEPKIVDIKPSRDQLGPYIISVEEFEEMNGNEKISLTYFMEDDVLMSCDDSVLDNGMMLVGGAENLEELENSEDGIIYIRNDKAGCDYEITREDGSYARYAADIYGLLDNE